MTVAFVAPFDGFDLDRLDPRKSLPNGWTVQPTNPELLEALAKDFQANNYSIQHLIKTIMKSNAYQLSARFDVLTFLSAPGPGLPSRSPRAPTILPNSDRTWTFGPTWYLNRFVKIQLNAQRERVTDIERKAVFGRNIFWTGICRLQIAM